MILPLFEGKEIVKKSGALATLIIGAVPRVAKKGSNHECHGATWCAQAEGGHEWLVQNVHISRITGFPGKMEKCQQISLLLSKLKTGKMSKKKSCINWKNVNQFYLKYDQNWKNVN